MMANVIHQEPLEIAGATVTSEVDDDHQGSCKVIEAFSEKLICAFPNFQESKRAAIYATTPDGGYGSVRIVACSSDQITYAEFVDWAF